MSGLAVETTRYPESCAYGLPNVDYTVDGAAGCGFAEAVAFGSLRQSYSVEAAAQAVSEVIKARQRKCSDIGDALATVGEAMASIEDTSDTDAESKISVTKLAQARTLLAKYGIDLPLTEKGQVTYATGYRKQNEVQMALDRETNDLQQNMTTLQGLVNKRDNVFNVSSKVVKKVNKTMIGTIRAIGA